MTEMTPSSLLLPVSVRFSSERWGSKAKEKLGRKFLSHRLCLGGNLEITADSSSECVNEPQVVFSDYDIPESLRIITQHTR